MHFVMLYMLAKRSELSFVILVRPLVTHADLIDKLRVVGISGNSLDWLTNFLFKRRQSVVLPESLWTFIKAGVP